MAEFGNLSIDTELLGLESKNGGVDDFGCESVGGHLRSGVSLSGLILSYDNGDVLIPKAIPKAI